MYNPTVDEQIINCDINDYFNFELTEGKNINDIPFDKLTCLDKYKLDSNGNFTMVKFKNKVHAIKRLLTWMTQ